MLQPRAFAAIAAVFVTASLAVGPVGAQAPLGFTIDPTQGPPGTVVTGQVDPADVAESCVTELPEFQNQFTRLIDEVFAVTGNPAETELFQRLFPGQTDFVFENCDQVAYSLTGLTAFGVSQNVNGAAETALPQTFVLTFANLATQDPIGQLSTFDPVTGTGTVVVPNLLPGSQAVVATCVGPSFDIDTLEAGIRDTGDFLRSLGFTDDICDPNEPEFEAKVAEIFGPGTDLFEFLAEIGTDVIQNIVEFQALGLQLFTVLPPPVNHFQCHAVRNVPFARQTVTLTDRFGTRTSEVRRATDLCAPADKNGEDPTAPDDPNHLAVYQLKGGGPFALVRGQTVSNQFGSITLDIRAQRSLMVPSTFSDDGPPSSPDGAFLSHFACYDVKVTNRTPRFTPRTVSVETPFERIDLMLQKPRLLCVPANKNGETSNAPTFPESLLCYQTKVRAGAFSLPAFFSNQFGEQSNTLRRRTEFCVPSVVGGPPASPSGAFLE